MHPGVWIGALGSVCAGLALILSLARTLYHAATEATANTSKIDALLADVTALQEVTAGHTTEIAVLQATRQRRGRPASREEP